MRREMYKYMREQGFWILRQNNHIVWFDGVIKITTSVSPSDYRALSNIKKNVEKARRAS